MVRWIYPPWQTPKRESEIQFTVARLLEQQHGKEYGYALLVRKTAPAVRDMPDQMQLWVVSNEEDPLLQRMWQDISPRDDVVGSGELKNGGTNCAVFKTLIARRAVIRAPIEYHKSVRRRHPPVHQRSETCFYLRSPLEG